MTLPTVLAALPYSVPPSLDVGPFEFHVFGFLVGCAIVFGTVMAAWRSHQLGLDERVTNEVALWAVIPGMIFAHVYSAVFYFPEKVLEDPLYLIYFWDGISSFGGFIGGAAGVMYYFRSKRIPFWPYADAVIFGFAFAWIFGRLGCTVAFDHPGLVTDFALGMTYPWSLNGEAANLVRHNLGFYEWLWQLPLFAVLWSQRNTPKFSGWYLAVVLIMYTPVRFGLDFLRASDAVYFGMTAGQYAAIALFGLAVVMYVARKRNAEVLVVDGMVHVFEDGRKAIPELEGAEMPVRAKRRSKSEDAAADEPEGSES